jgi:hypothetical protein
LGSAACVDFDVLFSAAFGSRTYGFGHHANV